MIPQSSGKIFLAGERVHTADEGLRCYHTFNCGPYQREHKTPFGALYMLNEETLAGGKSQVLFADQNALLIILPTVGAVHYTDTLGNKTGIEAGQAQWHLLATGTFFELSNPYADAAIQYIQLRIGVPDYKNNTAIPRVVSIDLEQAQNKLLQVILDKNVQKWCGATVAIGMFSGRAETTYTIAKPENGVFVFVLHGAFEVQHRLLESGDGLGLWQVAGIEVEALSNQALLLVIEVPMATG